MAEMPPDGAVMERSTLPSGVSSLHVTPQSVGLLSSGTMHLNPVAELPRLTASTSLGRRSAAWQQSQLQELSGPPKGCRRKVKALSDLPATTGEGPTSSATALHRATTVLRCSIIMERDLPT
jgi:hypothetical protein